jgi:hypothetical protein
LDSVGGGMVFNLFIEGEAPEAVEEGPDELDDIDALIAHRAFLQSIVEASPEEILAMGDLGEKLEQAYTRNADDKEIEALFMAAVNAYAKANSPDAEAMDSAAESEGESAALEGELGGEWLEDGEEGGEEEDAGQDEGEDAALDGAALDGANDQYWIATKSGSHLLIQGNPRKGFKVIGGAGGKFDGQKWRPKKIGKAAKAREFHEMTRDEFHQAHANVPVKRSYEGQSRANALDEKYQGEKRKR